MKEIICPLLLFVFIFTGCKDKPEKIEHEYLVDMVAKINVAPQHKWLVILPGLGCHGCIQEGEYFMKKHIDDPRILFVLTNISSIKILEQKTGLKLSNYPNVYIDKEKMYQMPTDNTIYPCIIELNNGNVARHSFQSPNTAVLHVLEQKL
jgi:hypothetical protein